MTHWAKTLGIASALALALGASLPATASADPSFCRSGAGHPVHGRRWCLDKGFGLGARSYAHYDGYSRRYPTYRRYSDYDRYDRYRTYDRYRPSWSYPPVYRSNDWRYNDWRGGSVYGGRYREPWYGSRWNGGPRWSSGHRHDRHCRH